MVYLASSSFWLQANSLVISFASFFLYVIFDHTLSQNTYGTYQYLLSLSAIALAFTLTGMGSSVARSVARGFEGTYRESIRVQLLWGLVPLLGSWALGGYYLWQSNATLGWGLVLMGIFIPISTSFNTYNSYLSAKKDFRRSFYYSLLANLPYYGSIALVAFSLPAALALLAANFISQTLFHFIAHRRVLAHYEPNDVREPGAIRYGVHLSAMNFLGSAISKLDDILTFHFLGAAALAVYSFATAIPDRLGIFSIFAGAAFPKFAEKSRVDIRSSLLRKTLMSIGAGAIIALIYTVIAHWFFLIFFPKYLGAVIYSQVYAFVVPLSFGSIFIVALTAHQRTSALYVYRITAPLILAGCELIGILGWGLWGLVIGKLTATLLISLLSVVLFLL